MEEQVKLDYASLPMHELRRIGKERGEVIKPIFTKKDIIKILEGGKIEIRKPQEHYPDLVEPAKVKPLLPKGFDENLKRINADLGYNIDTENNCINYHSKTGNRRIIPTCINIDSSERLIYLAAVQATTNAGFGLPLNDSNYIQASNIDNKISEADEERATFIAKLTGL